MARSGFGRSARTRSILWDEIGQALQTYRKVGIAPHLHGILRTITEMFTSAHTVYCSDTHANEKNDYRIEQPNLVVYGTSTPDDLFAGLTLNSIKNGFCGRLGVRDRATYDRTDHRVGRRLDRR